jgi:hypothetical protein
MKTLFIADGGKMQVVLTPESDFEKSLLSKYSSASYRAHIAHGSFSDCMGGYVRQYEHENSLFITLKGE